MPYQVIDLIENRSLGIFTGLGEARKAAHRVSTFQIWSGECESDIHGLRPRFVNDRMVDSCVIDDRDNESYVGMVAKAGCLFAILICWNALFRVVTL